MKNIGVWIDKEKAFVVVLDNEKESLHTIESNLENYQVHGGARSKTKWGPQDVVKEKTYLEREKQQLKNYFKEVVERLKEADRVTIFGPAEAGEKLQKEIKECYHDIAFKLDGVVKADSMTLNQIKALVRDYYKKESL